MYLPFFQIFSFCDTTVGFSGPKISWSELVSPQDKDGKETTVILGSGIFGTCQKRFFKGIPVAVKVFNNLSSSEDVNDEAAIMSLCSHPSLPHLFGLNIEEKPYFLVSYFYGIGSSSCTLYRALHSKTLSLSPYSWGKIMLKLCQALQHLHKKQLLHCDIKSDNILVTKINSDYHPMLIDFGKSIAISKAPSKQKLLAPLQQEEYRKKYRHIAPEIALGQPPSCASDIFSFGVVMSDVSSRVKTETSFLIGQNKCLKEDPKLRCSISYLLVKLENNLTVYQ